MRNLDVFNSKQPSKALAYNAHLHIQDISKKPTVVSFKDTMGASEFEGTLLKRELMIQGENNNQISYRKSDVRNNSIDGKDSTDLDGTKYKESSIRNVRSLPAIYYRQ